MLTRPAMMVVDDEPESLAALLCRFQMNRGILHPRRRMMLRIVVLLVLAGAVGGSLVWRRAAWPCPSWLVPLLENPYFEAVAGAAKVLERARIAPGMEVLDAGCGPGRLTVPAAEIVGPSGRVVALDVQSKMLARLERRLEWAGVANVEPMLAKLGENQLPESRFDVALLVTVFGEIPDKPAALEEIFRSLRPGGLLSITEVLPDPHYQRLARVRQLSTRAGFEEGSLYRGRLAYTLNLVKPGPSRA